MHLWKDRAASVQSVQHTADFGHKHNLKNAVGETPETENIL